jgi:hypothetical protein
MGILGHAIPSDIWKIEYWYGNNVTSYIAKIVTHKEALIDKKW